MSRLCLYLLGSPRIELDGEPVQVDTRKAVALLAYLALTREQQRRDALVNLLWPESDQSHGRAALRRTLSALRKALVGDWLDADRETIALNAKADVWLDIDRFHAHLQECHTHGHPASDVCAACLPHLAAAAKFYRGDFLSGFGLRDSFNFDDWQFFQTEGLRREWGETLERLVRCHSAQGDLETAIRHARRWLDLDRLNEAAHSQLMLLYTWSGRRSAALRQYQECVHILESNLGVAPQESTAELYKSILDGRAPAPPAALVLPATLAPAPEGGGQQVWVSPSGQVGPATPRTLPLSLEGEKRVLTVVCVDIGRSLIARGELDPEEETFLVDRFFCLVGDVFSTYGGLVVRALGTGVLGVLGTTQLHESDPELAIRAAVEIRREAHALGLGVTAGINTGQVYLSKAADSRGPAPVGTVVDLAVRLTGQAQTGQILVGESTYRLARRAFEFIPLTLEVGGIDGTVAAYRVERLLPHPRKVRGIEGLRAELIGRDEELSRLQKSFAQVLVGQGQMVSLIGDAGVGKSRLVAELRERALVPGEDGTMPLWLEGRCLELGTPTGYAPFVDMLREYLAWRPDEQERQRRDSIVYGLQRLVERGYLAEERAQEIGPLLGRLLSVRWRADTNHPDEWDDRLERESAEQIRNRTFAALYDLILALSSQRPVVLVFEDLHWADTLSLDLLSLLMEGLPQRRLLLLCVYRPEREHRCRHLATVAAQKCRECYTELHLRELACQQSWQMIESLLRVEVLSPEIGDLILHQSQGNPFFIEEVVRALTDAGILRRVGDGWQIHPESRVAVPASVQSVVLSRVDRLDESLKHVLQLASVIGRVFRRRVLACMMRAEAHLESALWELEERELVYQERAVPEVEYSFKHVLTQEAVYHNLAQSRRQALHRQVAEAIETLYRDSLEECSEQLAYHYDEGNDAEKAVAYLFRAGEKARRSHANEEAIAHLGRALELLKTLPESPERDRLELDLLVTMGIPLVLTKGHAAPKVREAYARARELSRRVGDTRQLFHILMGLRRYYLHRGEMGTAHQLGEQLLIVAQTSRAPLQLSRAHMMHGETLYWLGDFALAREHCEQGLALYDSQQSRSHVFRYGNDTGIGCRLVLVQVLWLLGYPDQAARGADKALALARDLSHPFTLVYALHFTAMIRQLSREVQVVRKQEEKAIRISREHGFALYLAWTTALHGWALTAQGQEDADIRSISAGIEQMQAGIATRRAEGGLSLLPHLLASLAEVCGRVGQVQEALTQIDEALHLAERSGERFWEAELHRLKGELLLARGEDAVQAEACFQRALDVARRQRAKSWELRAATSLARLWQRHGQTVEARALLQGVYDWFSEGFDTADLREAKALLDALA